MKNKIDFTTVLLTTMCFLLISSPYIPQRINNVVKLIIEIIITMTLLHKKMIIKKDLKDILPLLIFLVISFICTFKFHGLTSRIMNALVTSGAYLIFFLVVKVSIRISSKDKIINIIKKNIIFYSMILDLFVIVTWGKGLGGLDEAVYLIGNKFMLSYIHMLVLSFFSLDLKNKKNIILYFIYSIFLLKLADTTTGIIGIVSVLIIMFICDKNKKITNILSNPAILIFFFISINAIFLLVPEIYNINFIRNFFLKYSHTESLLSGRIVMYNICMKAIAQSPIFGYGINYDIVKDTLGFGNPQNGILKLLLDYGIIGLASFIVIIYVCFRKIEKKATKDFKIMMCSFIYSMFICSLVEINLASIFMLTLALTNHINYENKLINHSVKEKYNMLKNKLKKVIKN